MDEKIRGYESREARSGKSYATRKDAARQERANLEAEKATALAALSSEKSTSFQNLLSTYRNDGKAAKDSLSVAVAAIKQDNKAAEDARNTEVAKYGSGLGWFTVFCYILLVVSVCVDRILRKGAEIKQTVQIEAYDFRPSWWAEGWAAIRERFNQLVHDKITTFANETAAAPMPAQPSAVYDLTEALKHVTINLKLDREEEGAEPRTVYLGTKEPEQEPERQQIGFRQNKTTNSTATNAPTNSVGPLYATNHGGQTTNQEPPKQVWPLSQTLTHDHETTEPQPTNEPQETTDLRHAKQQLKKYKKRLGSHQQKAIIQQKNNGKVCKRTADAIQNNKQWIAHYEQIINAS